MQLRTEQCHRHALTAQACAEEARQAEARAKEQAAHSRRLLYLSCMVATAHALTAIICAL